MRLVMGKESGMVVVTVMRTELDKDIMVVMEDMIMLGTEIILYHMIVKLTHINKLKPTKLQCQIGHKKGICVTIVDRKIIGLEFAELLNILSIFTMIHLNTKKVKMLRQIL